MILKDIKFPIESFAQDVLEKISQEIQTTSEMTVLERKFLNGLLNYFRPRKILEVGVSAGGSSAIILNTIKNNEKAKLFSVDYSMSYYKDSSFDVGWKAKELFPDNQQWILKTGVDAAEVIEEIGSGIDFVLLDTVHRHPAETLSFISIFPYLSPHCVVVLHDINLFDPDLSEVNTAYATYATKILFDTITADKIIPAFDNNIYPNIGAFQINEDTLKYISDVLRSLYFPWGFQMDKRILNATEIIVKTKYSVEDFELFQKAITRMSELPLLYNSSIGSTGSTFFCRAAQKFITVGKFIYKRIISCHFGR
ncbi:MAG: class I SAM-dependent methyltransferase [Synergistaceae bacterium]|nr:class I SAM-dependent methyltransferase [Synergistaceae bacterium]